MTGFWIIVALLLAGALLFVVPPLLRGTGGKAIASQREVSLQIHRDQLIELQKDRAEGVISQEQYESGKREIERRVLDETASLGAAEATPRSGRWVGAVVALAVPAIALGLYLKLGNLDGLDPAPAAEVALGEQGDGHSITPQQIEAMVAQLVEKLKQDPENTEGWRMLARANVFMQRYGDAAKAFAEYTRRVPGDAQALSDYADALAMANGRTLIGEPEDIIAKALAADPNNIKALALAGSVEFDKQAYAKAVPHWEKILTLVPPESPIAESMRSGIAEARVKGGLPGGVPPLAQGPQAAAPMSAAPVAAGAAGQTAPAETGARVSGTVTLAPALKGRVSPSDTLFVFARAADGPRMPLAILRKQAKDLPVQFVLDDSMAMTPTMRLSSFPDVIVGARISKSGDAMPQKGDLQGATRPLANRVDKLTIVIDGEVN
ncbi:MAG: c-type cytochrome biogenesis protein CcmI [Sterolibacteriaceae bacterium]|nr:c-type cytochrome biogenesis protein CcmI [Sterolibacteriaceae bacterium]